MGLHVGCLIVECKPWHLGGNTVAIRNIVCPKCSPHVRRVPKSSNMHDIKLPTWTVGLTVRLQTFTVTHFLHCKGYACMRNRHAMTCMQEQKPSSRAISVASSTANALRSNKTDLDQTHQPEGLILTKPLILWTAGPYAA